MVGARDRDLAVLERLPQRIEHARIELRQLVEKQHAVVGERNLAGPGADAAAGQRRHAGGVMRRAERPLIGQRAAVEFAGDGRDHRHFEQLGWRQRRQDRRQPCGEHRLAGARRADHQEMMSAGGGDFERALGAFLSLDIAQIEQRCAGLLHFRLRAAQHLRALEMIGELDQRTCRDDLEIGRCPCGFRSAGRRTDQAFLARVRGYSRRQHARHRRDRSVEPEFAEHGDIRERIGGNRPDRRHQSERDRQIVVAAFLRQIGGSEVDGDAPRRQRKPRGDQRRTHPLARFRDGLVRQADDGEGRQAGRDLHLHVDGPSLNSLECDGGDALNHDPAPQPKVARRHHRIKNI